jgi:hypothetical protein
MQNAKAIVSSLIYQLSCDIVKVPRGINRHYDSCADGKRHPSPDAALEILAAFLGQFPQAIVVVDALDECMNRKELRKC